MSVKKNNFQLALDIMRGHWLLHNVESMLPLAASFLAGRAVNADSPIAEPRMYGDDIDYEDPASCPDSSEKKVFIVPLHGTMTKYSNCVSYGTAGLAESIVEKASDDEVIGMILDIDSPGGAVNSIMPLVEAISVFKNSGKPVIAHCDQCASAALWVASKCDAIFLDNEMSQIGSLGAYVSIIDNSTTEEGAKVVTIYADESEDKNKAVRDALDGKFEAMKKELSVLVGKFRAAVTAGRPSLKTEAEGVMTGAMFYPDEAMAVGFADGVATLKECVENIFVRAELNKINQ